MQEIEGGRAPYLVTSINYLHWALSAPEPNGKRELIFSSDFVMPSLHHTMRTRGTQP